MIRILAPTLIALSVSTASWAQQAADAPEPTLGEMTTDSAENVVEETEAAADNLAQDVDSMDTQVPADRTMLRRPANVDRAGYMVAEPEELTAEALTGVRVYSSTDEEDIGEVDELLLSEDGTTVERVVVDVGGFLGMGEHEVAVTMEELHIMRSDDGMDFRVYMDATQEELEAQPEYDG
ncbi:PRC-barrel domain-containing protein [Granulosicoccus sp. 3-233]|uniref:PRC-barrel domain-containing protein n=1 Tax=Granulosicoccus sp. 3-233 TaxID=3417969 RepID=UPI003D34F009